MMTREQRKQQLLLWAESKVRYGRIVELYVEATRIVPTQMPPAMTAKDMIPTILKREFGVHPWRPILDRFPPSDEAPDERFAMFTVGIAGRGG